MSDSTNIIALNSNKSEISGKSTPFGMRAIGVLIPKDLIELISESHNDEIWNAL